MKHLFLLEKFGLIESFKAKSNLAAPDRKYFQLNRSVYLSIGITGDSMEIRMENIKGPNKVKPKNRMTTEIKGKYIQRDKEITDILKNTKLNLELIEQRMEEIENEKIGLLKDKQSWDSFKKSKAQVDENFINHKIKDRNEARKKGNYKLADTLRKDLEDNGVIIEDKQEKTTWKYK